MERRRIPVERLHRLLKRGLAVGRLGTAHVAIGDPLGAAECDHRVLEEGRVGVQAAEHAVVLDEHRPRVQVGRD